MAAIDTPRAAYLTVNFFGRMGQTIANMFGAVAAWNDARITRNSLDKLTDRELEDIGLCRGDIDSVTRA